MNITILGSGTGIPSIRRASPGILVEAENRFILLDSGPGTLRQLSRIGVGCHQLDFLCYTHFHPDHTLDLLAFLFASRNPLQPRRDRPFEILGPAGLEAWLQRARDLYGDWVAPAQGTCRIREFPQAGGRHTLTPGLTLHAVPVDHTPQSLGFRLRDSKGRTMAYSGDTDVCDSLVDLGRGVDVFFLDCSMPDDQRIPGHLTPSLAAHIAARAQARRLVLTHFYPPCDRVDVVQSCRDRFAGEIIAAEDLMTITL